MLFASFFCPYYFLADLIWFHFRIVPWRRATKGDIWGPPKIFKENKEGKEKDVAKAAADVASLYPLHPVLKYGARMVRRSSYNIFK